MTFKINSPFGKEYTCSLDLGEYADNRHIAVQIWDEEGPYATLTVNLPETRRHPQNFAFLDVNNFPSGPDLVERLGIGKSTGKYGWSGYCAYPLYEMYPEKIREYCWDAAEESAEDAEPEEEMTVYKMFRLKGGKLFPLFVEASREMPVGEILTANVGAIGKDSTHVKSRIGDLSLRPGFHSTTIPFSDWIGKRMPDGSLAQRRDTVWAECSVPGHEITVTARNGLQEIPDGWYRFKTNSRQRDPWVISDRLVIKRILPYEEVCAICREHGLEPQKMED